MTGVQILDQANHAGGNMTGFLQVTHRRDINTDGFGCLPDSCAFSYLKVMIIYCESDPIHSMLIYGIYVISTEPILYLRNLYYIYGIGRTYLLAGIAFDAKIRDDLMFLVWLEKYGFSRTFLGA